MGARGKIEALRAKTVDRGATPAEAKAAAELADKLEASRSVKQEEAREALREYVPEAYRLEHIVNALPNIPPWRGPDTWRWPLLHDWANSHDHKDPYSLETQMRFLAHDLATLNIYSPTAVAEYCQRLKGN